MKLIIDIPEEVLKTRQYTDYFKCGSTVLTEVLDNGIPLENIKAEITNIPITDTDGHNNNWYREPQAIIDDVLQIIDKHIEENK